MVHRNMADYYNTTCHALDPDTVIVQGMRFVRERTCRYVWDEKQHAWVCDQCGGIEPCSNDVSYCCDCGARVVG